MSEREPRLVTFTDENGNEVRPINVRVISTHHMSFTWDGDELVYDNNGTITPATRGGVRAVDPRDRARPFAAGLSRRRSRVERQARSRK